MYYRIVKIQAQKSIVYVIMKARYRGTYEATVYSENNKFQFERRYTEKTTRFNSKVLSLLRPTQRCIENDTPVSLIDVLRGTLES